jgi:hypothetical protein
MRAPPLVFVWISGIVADLVPCGAYAQDSHLFPVATSGSCPESSAVQSVLAGLLPTKMPREPAGNAKVSDLGDSYVVAVGDQVKTYTDAARDCAERARVAAAFVALVLSPETPRDVDTKLAVAPVSAQKPVETARSRSPGQRWLRVDARGTLDGAPASGLLAPGLALGIAVGQGKFGAQAVCGWVSGTSLSVEDASGSVLLERFPCALGPMLRFRPAPVLEIGVATSLVVGALVAEGAGFGSNKEATRLEVGARASIDATLHVGGHVAPVLGLEATYDPMTYDLEVLSRGVVAQTPSFWAGVSAGVSWSIP